MRVVVLALMIILLPVRGWLGDAMAVGMASHEISASALTASADVGDHIDRSIDSVFDTDCLDHSDSASTQHTDCSKCAACDVCHGVALTLGFTPVPPAGFQSGTHPSIGADFVSAEPHQGFKPPIL